MWEGNMNMTLGWGVALGFLLAGSFMGIVAQILDWKERLSHPHG